MRIGATMLWATLLFAVPASAASLSDAQSAYDQNHVADAERMFAAVAADSTASTIDRSAAERELARIAWLIDGDAKRSFGHLAAAARFGDKPCSTAEMTARVLRESKQDREALERGAVLIQSCPEPSDRDLIRTHLIGARLDLATKNEKDRAQLLATASTEATKFSPDADVEAARVRLEIALLTADAARALAAWKDYFWLDETDAPQALEHQGVTALFNKGLAPNASVADRLSLADLLMRAGFAEQSRRYAEAYRLGASAPTDPTFRRLDAYWRERDMLEAVLLGVNRGLARGQRDDTALEAAAKSATVALMRAAGASGEPKAALLKYYGLVGSVGMTSGYPSIHMGHVIEDHDDTVTQFGHSAKIHFMAIDNMIANGFESWLWDGSAAVGGWTADGVIVHIRPGYVTSPLRGYALTGDSALRKELIGRQGEHAAEDIARLKAHPVATLEGLNDRLLQQFVDQIDAGVRSRVINESDIRRAFLAEYSRANLNQSIRVHEGRHAIDEALGISAKVEQPVLEYRAKLSELELTPYPCMALRNMNRNLEGDGPHDKAGARIFDEYRRWIEAHREQIMGYDPTIPALAQLDKLTDGQIREVAHGLDPLASGNLTSPGKL